MHKLKKVSCLRSGAFLTFYNTKLIASCTQFEEAISELTQCCDEYNKMKIKDKFYLEMSSSQIPQCYMAIALDDQDKSPTEKIEVINNAVSKFEEAIKFVEEEWELVSETSSKDFYVILKFSQRIGHLLLSPADAAERHLTATTRKLPWRSALLGPACTSMVSTYSKIYKKILTTTQVTLSS
jgi:hypothetical protein